ncbi:MAG: hypothetical protein LBR73_02300 [Oscillospiraceae bacterium]|jgi:hypothetical protein|nr:hypothetical protein [Oscillospiraceae bacterium]
MKLGKRVLALVLSVLLLLGVFTVGTAAVQSVVANYAAQLNREYDKLYAEAAVQLTWPMAGQLQTDLDAVSRYAACTPAADTGEAAAACLEAYTVLFTHAKEFIGVPYSKTAEALLGTAAEAIVAGEVYNDSILPDGTEVCPGTTVEATFWNWFLYIVCFGWLWMPKA